MKRDTKHTHTHTRVREHSKVQSTSSQNQPDGGQPCVCNTIPFQSPNLLPPSSDRRFLSARNRERGTFGMSNRPSIYQHIIVHKSQRHKTHLLLHRSNPGLFSPNPSIHPPIIYTFLLPFPLHLFRKLSKMHAHMKTICTKSPA